MMNIESYRSRTQDVAAYVEPQDQVSAILTGRSVPSLDWIICDQSGTHLQK